MHRASISISSDSDAEKVAFEAWCALWKEKMSVFSDDYGCGCCVHLYDVEGPEEAIQAIPPELRTGSGWSESAKTIK
jgi:hypothetical protein